MTFVWRPSSGGVAASKLDVCARRLRGASSCRVASWLHEAFVLDDLTAARSPNQNYGLVSILLKIIRTMQTRSQQRLSA